MSRVFEMAFELSGRINNSVRTAFSGLNRDVESLNNRIGQMERSRGNITRFKELRTDILRTNREYQAAQQNVNRLAREIRNTAEPSRQLQSEFERATRNASNLNGRLRDQRSELTRVRGSLDEAGISTRNLSQEQAELERTIARTARVQAQHARSGERLEQARQNTAEARGKLTDAVAMAATVVVPVKLAMDAENTMADIKKVVDFDDIAEVKGMEKTIMDITKNIPMGFNDIGSIIAAGGQAGLNKLELPDFAKDSAKMGVAFDISAEDAGQTMAEWRSAFKMDQDQVRTLADKVNYLGDTTAANAPKIAAVVTKIGPLGEVSGVASGEIAALGATLVGMGISEDVAATGIKGLMLTMNAGGAATKTQAAAFSSLGLDAESMAKKMQTDSKGAILELLEALKQVPEHARAAKLQQLVGKEAIGAIAPLLNNIGELEKNLNSVDEAQKKFSGSMESEFQARAATTGNSIILLKNQMSNMGITIGAVLLPPITELATRLAEGASMIAGFAEKHPKLTSVLVIATAAFLAFNVALIAGVYATSLVKESYASVAHGYNKLKLAWIEGTIQARAQAVASKVQAVATRAQALGTSMLTGAQSALNAVTAAFPGFLIIAAILAVIAVGVALYQNWDVVKEKLGQLWSWFSEKFPGMAEFASSAAGVIKNTFGGAINWVKEKVAGLGEAWNKVKGAFGGGSGGGGGKDPTSIPKLPGYATGGIVTSPQIAWVGEGGSAEAIIPLEKTANSIGLWQQTGRMLGMDFGASTSPISKASDSRNQESKKFRGIELAANHSDGRENITVNSNADNGNKYEFSFSIDARGASEGVDKNIEDSILQKVIPIVMRAIDQRDKDIKRLEIS